MTLIIADCRDLVRRSGPARARVHDGGRQTVGGHRQEYTLKQSATYF